MTTAQAPPPEHDQAHDVPAEDHPTGTAWRAPRLRADPPELPLHYQPCTPAEQARNLAALLEGISGYVVGRPGRPG
ncbi:hypothetical protein [Streptomyces sp. NPDC002845]